jgi:hypothetical protein
MNELGDWLRANGIDIATTPKLMHIGLALGLAVLAVLIGEFAGRRLGAMLAARWELHSRARIDGLGPRLAAIVGHTVALLLLALILNGYDWKLLAALPLGLRDAWTYLRAL